MNDKNNNCQLATGLATVQQRMDAALAQRLAPGGEVVLVAASKGQSVAMIEQAIGLGITHFGENRVQEAQEKWPLLKKKYPHVVLHLIGPLQSNKVADALALFDVIETVDREKLVQALVQDSAAAQSRRVLIQVNTGEEPQKGGVTPHDLPALLAACRAAGLAISGLMCLPPAQSNPAPHFALLKKLADRAGLPDLSMGMSGDFDTAIRLGATHVRVGTALFGARVAFE